MLSLEGVSRELVPERELDGDPLRLDLWCVPDRQKLAALKPLGLLHRIVEQGACAFEFFHQAPTLEEVLSSLRKAFLLRQPARIPARIEEPWLWILAAGRPSQLVEAFGFSPESGWPPGVYAVPPALRARLVVISELPRTIDTLLIRALGAGSTLRDAQRDLRESGLDHPVGRIVIPLMLRLHFEHRNDPDTEEDLEAREFVMETQDAFEAWQTQLRAEEQARGQALGQALGEARGRAKALCLVLASRGIAVNAEQARQIETCLDIERLDRWLVRAGSATRCEEVLD